MRVAAIRAIGGLAQPGVEPWAQQLLLSDAPNEVRVQALRLLGMSVPGLNAILDLAEAGRIPTELRLSRLASHNAAPPPAAAAVAAAIPSNAASSGSSPTNPTSSRCRARAAKRSPCRRVIPTALQLNLTPAAEPRKAGRSTTRTLPARHVTASETDAGHSAPTCRRSVRSTDKQAMLDDILNPNGAIGPEYITTVFTMKNGSTVSGLITGETATEVTIAVGTESQRLRTSDIASRKPVQVSSMPEGLLDNLSLQQIADLLEFLSTLK